MPRRKESVVALGGIFDFLDPSKEGSIFDAFSKPTNTRKEKKEFPALPAPKSSLPAVRKTEGALTELKKEKLKEKILSLFMPPLPEVKETRRAVAPEAPWEVMFSKSKDQPALYEEIPAERTEPISRHQFIDTGLKRIPYGGPWEAPDIQTMVDHLSEKVDLESVFQNLLENRSMPYYQDVLAEAAFRGIPLYVPISIIDDKNFFTDFADFYGIPWSVVERMSSPEEFFVKVLSPLSIVLTEAFEVLKPDGLPGFFTVDHNGTDGHYWLYYVEPWLGRLPGP